MWNIFLIVSGMEIFVLLIYILTLLGNTFNRMGFQNMIKKVLHEKGTSGKKNLSIKSIGDFEIYSNCQA